MVKILAFENLQTWLFNTDSNTIFLFYHDG